MGDVDGRGSILVIGIPTDSLNCDIQRFTAGNAVFLSPLWSEVWRKPKGCTMGFFWGIGGGGGGGAGWQAVAGTARGGGGGGGSGGICTLLIPLIFVPDELYVLLGTGGAGSNVFGGGGINGGLTILSAVPALDPSNLFLQAGNGAAAGGNNGSATGGGAGGGGGTTPNISLASLAQNGFLQAYPGQTGKGGGAQTGAIGIAATIATASGIAMGGAGGAGTTNADFAGGTFTTIVNTYISEQMSAAHAAGSVSGPGGILVQPPRGPLWSISGGGGSSSNAGVAGAGGNGLCGGGGGGGGAGATGGRGGTGGTGMLVAVCW